ncbi:GUN4 domain-containing protein [Anabaena sp. WFMT]|uniref:GUN4 domain-containing protein n=1 Tax=Anabaena sp. WFMT TaxID=3449730 RepID=UPI003F265E1A
MNNPQEPGKYDQANLKSAVEQDYTRLHDLLAAEKWKEADKETARVMLAVMKRGQEGWLDVEHIDNFPCEDLCIIDKLWIRYSNGKFGFSVQKNIYQGLGGTRNYEPKIWTAFEDKVGWRKEGKHLLYEDMILDKTAPEGHLPKVGGMAVGIMCKWLFSRVKTCKV